VLVTETRSFQAAFLRSRRSNVHVHRSVTLIRSYRRDSIRLWYFFSGDRLDSHAADSEIANQINETRHGLQYAFGAAKDAYH
jgi:hypothetical protein